MNTTEGEGAKSITWDESINGESRSEQVGIQDVMEKGTAATSLQVFSDHDPNDGLAGLKQPVLADTPEP